MLPVLVVIFLGSIDIAQYINVAQTVCNASREGARLASRDSTMKVAEVKQAVRNYMRNAFPTEDPALIGRATLIDVTDEAGNQISYGNMENIPSGGGIRVRVVFNYEEVRWIHGIRYWNSNINESISVSRRE
jgi:Flp pilus assembly protein TadG